uniref:Uncharacterized protein n=1 Tax=viral metagenome TaxID=1070528 RepID=A0A6C0IME7_9ZZZZ
MEFVLKNDEININDLSLNLTNDNSIINKLFYLSEISNDISGIHLYLDKSQITENLNFNCMFPSDSKIEKIYISNNQYPFYLNEGIKNVEESISYTNQSFSIIIDKNSFNIFSYIKQFKKKV